MRGTAARRTTLLRMWVENGNTRDIGSRLEETRKRKSRLGMMFPPVQSDLTRVIHARDGKRLLAGFRKEEGDAAKRALVRVMAIRTKGVPSWVSCQGLSPRETIETETWTEIIGMCA